jgi:hypothetical protein
MTTKIIQEFAWAALASAINAQPCLTPKDKSHEEAVDRLPLSFSNRASLWNTMVKHETPEYEDQTDEQYALESRRTLAQAVAVRMGLLAAHDPRVTGGFNAEDFIARCSW